MEQSPKTATLVNSPVSVRGDGRMVYFLNELLSPVPLCLSRDEARKLALQTLAACNQSDISPKATTDKPEGGYPSGTFVNSEPLFEIIGDNAYITIEKDGPATSIMPVGAWLRYASINIPKARQWFAEQELRPD